MDNEKDLGSLNTADLGNVSGGYKRYSNNEVHCDNCGKVGAFSVPGTIGFSHLCIECAKNIKEEFGEELFSKIFPKD